MPEFMQFCIAPVLSSVALQMHANVHDRLAQYMQKRVHLCLATCNYVQLSSGCADVVRRLRLLQARLSLAAKISGQGT